MTQPASFVASLNVAPPDRPSWIAVDAVALRSLTFTASEPWSSPKARTPGEMRLSSVTGLRPDIAGHVTTVETFM